MDITRQFNSLSTTGPRVEGMLKHFYNNIKHRARKVSASENKKKYLAELRNESYSEPVDDSMLHGHFLLKSDSELNTDEVHAEESHAEEVHSQQVYTVVHTEQDHAVQVHSEELYTEDVPPIDEKIIKDLKKKWTDDKKYIRKTGGGSFDPTLTDSDHQILAILDDQIRPVENPYDEAAQYFGETLTEPVVITIPKPKVTQKRKPVNSDVLFKNKTNTDCKKSAESLKKIYFKKKIELTFYQKKNEMLKFRQEQKRHQLELRKHELEMKILKKRLDQMDRNVATTERI